MAGNRIKLMLTIVERGQGKNLLPWYAANQVAANFQTIGRGTASSDLLDLLGFVSSERDVLISLGEATAVNGIMSRIKEHEMRYVKASGLACTMSVAAMNTIVASALLNHANSESNPLLGGKDISMDQGDHNLILVVVNQGYTEQVMHTAREAGARGGTIIRSRWAGDDAESAIFGISIQAEKEVIAIISGVGQRNQIMEMINKQHGIHSEAESIICSLPLDQVQYIR